jgi:uncharacterized protein (DUF1499 family)
MPWTIAVLAVVGFVAAALVVLRLLAAASARRRPVLGVANGKLTPCPATPNCVSTQAGDSSQFIEPVSFSGAPAEIINRLAKVVSSMPGATIVDQRDDYLRAEFKSRVFGFVDDVEFFGDGRAARCTSARPRASAMATWGPTVAAWNPSAARCSPRAARLYIGRAHPCASTC